MTVHCCPVVVFGAVVTGIYVSGKRVLSFFFARVCRELLRQRGWCHIYEVHHICGRTCAVIVFFSKVAVFIFLGGAGHRTVRDFGGCRRGRGF